MIPTKCILTNNFLGWQDIYVSYSPQSFSSPLAACLRSANQRHGDGRYNERADAWRERRRAEKRPRSGTTTELDGTYRLDVPAGDVVLLFSFLGYKTREVQVGAGFDKVNTALEEDAQQLGEVVVTALGIKRQKRELGYSTERFDGNEVLLSNAPNVVSSLSGRSAGVQVATPNGVDGGTTRITIRGNNSISANNQPLIVVDGVPLENESGLNDIGRGRDWGSAINNINPNDIENINILKGPTAAALYGSRGGNGVVLITTKRGSQQKGIGINYNVSHKVIQPYYYRDVQNIFGAGGPISLNEPTLPTDANGNFIYPAETHAENGPTANPRNRSSATTPRAFRGAEDGGAAGALVGRRSAQLRPTSRTT
ncbi:MAG: TonB-dependent receptor plug domain-containing protein [Saprospiraceae bacterium]|nr:TonB-dependent receptor plug domain-containing protein [Saprospiraceae bacterium]